MTNEQYRDLEQRLRDEHADCCGEGLSWEAARAIRELMMLCADIRNAALDEAAQVINDNMLCDGLDGEEVMIPRTNPGNKLGEAYVTAIKALKT